MLKVRRRTASGTDGGGCRSISQAVLHAVANTYSLFVSLFLQSRYSSSRLKKEATRGKRNTSNAPCKHVCHRRFLFSLQIIEKRRRDRINNCLVELRRLVPAAFEKQVSSFVSFACFHIISFPSVARVL